MAIDCYKSALRINPDDDETRYNMSLAIYLFNKNNDSNANNKDNQLNNESDSNNRNNKEEYNKDDKENNNNIDDKKVLINPIKQENKEGFDITIKLNY
jgi:hypothetical protein